MDSALNQFMQNINYQFQNMPLLKQALRHRSFSKNNNERLEFLGDAMVNFIIAAELYSRFPRATEGQLSRLRSALIKGETLAALASEFDLGSVLQLGRGEQKSGGAKRISILENSLEALIGALYLDVGMEGCFKKVIEWFESRFANLSPKKIWKDPKSRLQEFLQARQLALPEYRLVKTQGKAHDQIFTVNCVTELFKESTRGTGSSRRKAEQQAARKMLEKLEIGTNE